MQNIPTYYIDFNENDPVEGIDLISFVAEPAILTKGVRLSKSEIEARFKKETALMEVLGPILVPDLPIYRKDELGEYYLVFTSRVIKSLYNKFIANVKEFRFNDNHSDTIVSAQILESWIKEDMQFDKSNAYEELVGLPVGTAFIKSKLSDIEYWENEVVGNDKFGYSIEGFLSLKMQEIKKLVKQEMEKAEQKSLTLAVHKKADGSEIFIDGEIAIDSYVYSNHPTIVLVNDVKTEMKYPSWESVIELEDGSVLLLADSKIVEITKKETEPAEIIEEVQVDTDLKTKKVKEKMKRKFKFEDYKLQDGKMISVDGELAVGSDVYYVAEDGSKETIDAGEYILESGQVIIADADGKITEVKEPEVVADEPKEEALAIDPETQATLDELRAIIAELTSRIEMLESWKAEDIAEDVLEEEMTDVKMSAQERKEAEAQKVYAKLESLKKFGNPFEK
jgi:hypothetical protein